MTIVNAKRGKHFKERVYQWADRIGVNPTIVQIRPMKHKWASCSTTGRVSFSKDLLRKSRNFREYVIVHELLHLQVPNHGKLFKSLLRAYLPEWKGIIEYEKLGCRSNGNLINNK